jgi:hypothetical protein
MAARLRRTQRIEWMLAIGLLACFAGYAAQDQPPDTTEQERILNAMRGYAEQYVANLPNFLCELVTRQYQAGRKPNHWRRGDVLTSRLLFSEGQEQHSLELVNDKPIRAGSRPWRAPLQTEGEFGILLANVLASASDASYEWKQWDVVRGRRVAVFEYSIDVTHSTLTLSLSDLAKATIPYHGTVYGDPETGAVWRITNAASDLPAEIQTKSISTVIDYDQILIGDKTYLLPVQASVWLTTDSNNVRNDLEFRNYRKFETDSVIKFASADEPAPPKN